MLRMGHKTGTISVWNSEFRTSAHGIAMVIPRADVRNRHLHRHLDRSLGPNNLFTMKIVMLVVGTNFLQELYSQNA